MHFGLFIFGLFLHWAKAEVPEALQDVQTEFYLPYSTTEDVDFSLNKPGGFGCYQWFTTVEDVVALDPITSDYENMCGSRLEFKILKNNGHPNVDFTIKAENVDIAGGYDHTEIPQVVEYTIHVRPLAKLEVLGLKTDLVAGSDPVPFGVAGYDAEDNEFDTLDGLQLAWFIGSKREIAEFEAYRTLGPIVKVMPVGTGKGAVICTVTDPNYEKVEPSYMEFSVKADLFIEPDGAFLLEGGVAHLRLMEKTGKKDELGQAIIKEIKTSGEDADYSFAIKEAEYVSFDKASNNMTGVKLGETTVFVKNADGEIIKGMPIRVTKAHSVSIVTEPEPESKQLILDHEYKIKVNIFNKEGRPVYPSENILCKTTFPRQFQLLHVAENGLEATIKTTSVGLGKVKSNLRSVLDPEDEELEILPHVKGSTDFEVYEQVQIEPKMTVLPWDDNLKPNYTMRYKAKGGGQVYSYSIDDLEAGTVDNEGMLITSASSAVSFKVKAYMPKGESNFDEAEFHILAPTHLEMKVDLVEFNTMGHFRGNLKFFTMLPKTNDKILYSDCSNIPYQIKLSDEENFFVEYRSPLGTPSSHQHCAYFHIKAKKPGLTTKVSVSYLEPSSGRTLRASTTITSYEGMSVAHPKKDYGTNLYKVLLPIGSTTKLVFYGGPQPWASKPAAHYKHMEVEDNRVAKVTYSGSNEQTKEHVYDATCLTEGSTEVTLIIGNSRTETNAPTASEERKVQIDCAMPFKLAAKYEHVDETSKLAHSPKLNRVLAHKDKDLKLTFTLKDKKGRTFTSTDSLKVETKVSDESILSLKTSHPTIPQVAFNENVKLPGKPEHVLKVSGKEGPVDIKMKLAGYNQEVLDKVGITNPPALPKVIDDDEDMDYEDEEDFEAHAHALLDELELYVTSSEEMAKVTPK